EGRLDALEAAGGDDRSRVVADDAEGAVPVVEQLLSGQPTGVELVTDYDADSVPGDRGVEGDDSDGGVRGGPGVGSRGFGVGLDDDQSSKVIGLALVDESLLTVRVVRDHRHHRPQVHGGEFGYQRGEGTGMEGGFGIGEDDDDVGRAPTGAQ